MEKSPVRCSRSVDIPSESEMLPGSDGASRRRADGPTAGRRGAANAFLRAPAGSPDTIWGG